MRAAGEKFPEEVFSALPDALLLLDRQGNITYANPASLRLFGCGGAGLKGKPVAVILTSVELQGYISGPSRESLTDLEIESTSADGKTRVLNVSVSALQSGAEGVTGFVCEARDITARMLQSRQLSGTNADLQRIVYITTHHLQEPLRLVASYLALIEKSINPDEKTREYFHFAQDGAVWMKHMLDDITLYSSIGTRRRTMKRMAGGEVLEKAVKGLEPIVVRTGARIEHGPLPEMIGDEYELVLLFRNFIGNSLKFRSAEPPLIRVSAEMKAPIEGWPSPAWMFRFQDNGIGIAKEYHQRVFRLFETLYPRSRYLGTGTGLAICKKIVDNYGGWIWVESEEGKGSTFYFTLPYIGR